MAPKGDVDGNEYHTSDADVWSCGCEEELQTKHEEPYRFCTFSRVMKEKGIEIAIDAVEAINKKAGRVICTLDIYGKIDDGYVERFKMILQKSSEAIQYRGMVPFDRSVEAIKNYYALLFPTFWDGEGFAGTIVDAFSAGLPVIATDWNCNGEIIDDEVNGILYPNSRIATLEDAIAWTVENQEQMSRMKKKCIEKAWTYQPEWYVEKIIDRIEG